MSRRHALHPAPVAATPRRKCAASGIAVLGGTGVVINSSDIGTDATGTRGLQTSDGRRQRYGVRIAGGGGHRIGESASGGSPWTGNVISGNGNGGVLIERTDGSRGAVSIASCRIGTDPTGQRHVGNGGDGVLMSASGAGGISIYRNVISGNGGAGLRLTGTVSANVMENFVGTNDGGITRARATTAIPNQDGIVVGSGAHSLDRNYISGNRQSGVRVVGVAWATLTDNRIGTDFYGNVPVPNGGNGVEVIDANALIGGPSRKNVISGNRGHGVLVAGAGANAQVWENHIGTNAYGNLPLGNGGSGIYLAASSTDVIRNVISANGGDGVTITDFFGTLTGFNRVLENAIGTNADRSLSAPGLGNAGHGVAIFNSSNNQVGEFNSNRPTSNTIAFNGGTGVLVRRAGALPAGAAADRNVISSNSNFANGGPGIDLGGDGVTPNDPLDPDAGPNRLQNFPIVRGPLAVPRGSTFWTVRFTLDAEPNQQHTVQLFSSPAPDPAGAGEGRTPLATVTVRTDAAGHAEAGGTFRVAAGTWVTATATGPGGTSEFSPAVPVTGTAVVGRHVFYNNSAFDGQDPAANVADDGAVATDKRPFRPWEVASFANVTSYPKGINGVMIDIARLPEGASLAASDFLFRKYYPSGPGGPDVLGGRLPPGWYATSGPASITVRRGAGVGGSDRVTLTWPDRVRNSSEEALVNEWLEVTVKATLRTGLGQPDVFYLGNRTGETGDGEPPVASALHVTAIDLAGTRRAMGMQPVPVSSPYDHNRDGVVNGLDVAVVRSNLGKSLSLLYPRFSSTAAAQGGRIDGASSLLRDGAPAVAVA